MIRIGIAGFGKIGQLRCKILSSMENIQIVGIYDVNKPDTSYPGEFFRSYEDLLNSNIDAVIICAYNTVLADYTTKALDCGIHVFCEKPPAMNIAQLNPVFNSLKQSGKVLKYGFNHRYHYSVIEAKKIIDSGEMGKLLWMRGVYGKAGSIDYDQNWRNYKKFSGGGILIDQGIHMLDLMRFLSNDEFQKVHSYITTAYWNIKVEDNAFILMKSNKGITASMHSSATQWRHKFLLELCFEDGYLNLDGILSGTRSYAPETLIIGKKEFEDVTYAMGKPKETLISFENDHSWELEIEEFIKAIRGTDNIKQGTLNDAFETLSLVERVYNQNILK